MQQQIIDSCTHPLYEKFKNLYRVSFPIFEQRSETQQMKAFQNERYKLQAFTNDDSFVGFISGWLFDTYCYIEHFAINSDLRGNGYGSEVLRAFVKSMNTMVILEIDPIVDAASAARLRFYQRSNFYQNPYPHRHPQYNKKFLPHPLVVLSTERPITKDEYALFYMDLNEVVMK